MPCTIASKASMGKQESLEAFWITQPNDAVIMNQLEQYCGHK